MSCCCRSAHTKQICRSIFFTEIYILNPQYEWSYFTDVFPSKANNEWPQSWKTNQKILSRSASSLARETQVNVLGQGTIIGLNLFLILIYPNLLFGLLPSNCQFLLFLLSLVAANTFQPWLLGLASFARGSKRRAWKNRIWIQHSKSKRGHKESSQTHSFVTGELSEVCVCVFLAATHWNSQC